MDTDTGNFRDDDGEVAAWPYVSILVWGTFGSRSPEGRRYHRRTIAALMVMVLSFFFVGSWADRGTVSLGLALVPGAAFAFIGWEFARYLRSLDELARRLQLEAIASTYLVGMVGAMCLAGLVTQAGVPIAVHPAWFLVLEPFRAVVLYRLARRY